MAAWLVGCLVVTTVEWRAVERAGAMAALTAVWMVEQWVDLMVVSTVFLWVDESVDKWAGRWVVLVADCWDVWRVVWRAVWKDTAIALLKVWHWVDLMAVL